MYIHIYTNKRCFICVHVRSIGKANFTAFSLSSHKKKVVPLYTKAQEKTQTSAQLQMLNQINTENSNKQ